VREQVETFGRSQTSPFDPVRKVQEAANRRANPTRGEESLEKALRRRGVWFKREEHIEGFVVDFYVQAAKTVIEVDGPHHIHQQEKDRRRDDHLKANHHRVIRVSADDAVNDPGAVVERLDLAAIKRKQADWSAGKKKRSKTSQALQNAPRNTVASGIKRTSDAGQPLKRPSPPPAPPRRNGWTRPEAKPPVKRKFQCQTCERTFVAAVEPWPKCNHCGDSVCKVLCRVCDQPLPAQATGTRCILCINEQKAIGDSRKGGASTWWKSGSH